MATPKKGQGIAFRIPGPADVPEAGGEETMDSKVGQPRTGVGMLSRLISGAQADTEAVTRLNAEVDKLKLQVGEQFLEPRQIALTRWADRHPDSFASAAFVEFKQEIANAGGNVQPIKVRPIRGSPTERDEGVRFELVYGSRRTRACLELGLPVRAIIDENVDDQTLYIQMQRENRGRSNLSAWEQGVSYHRALQEGLFSSGRRLAEQIGLDHSNVAKALRVAELPQEIIGAFPSPVEIQFRWAVTLDKAYQRDPDGVLTSARKLISRSPRPNAVAVFRALTEASTPDKVSKSKELWHPLVLTGGKKGAIRRGKGGTVTVELPHGVLPQARWADFESGLRQLLSELQQPS